MNHETYVPRIKTMLDEVRKDALERGFQCDEPYDMTDEEVRWNVLVRPADATPDQDVGVDVSITILESEACDGTKGGCNFALEMVEYEGLIVGGMVPYNFTEHVWVPRDDENAVETRWRVFNEHFSASSIVDRIVEFYEKHLTPVAS